MKKTYPSVVDFVNDLSSEVNSIAICGTSYSDTGGVARVIEQQALALSEQEYDVDIYTLTATTESPPSTELHEIGRFETTPYKELDKLLTPVTPDGWRFFSDLGGTDLVIAHRFPFSVLSYVASTVHDTEYVFWSHPSQSSDELFDGVAKVWAKLQHHFETQNFAIKRADHICAVSEKSRSYIESKTGRNAIFVPNAVPESRFTDVESVNVIEDRYDIDPTDTVVLHVGRISPRKNIEELVDSFEAVTDIRDNCKLVLVGKENMDDYSESVRERAGNDVIFTGFVDDKTLAGLYERSDVYATCSLSEGWGLPLSEASRFGTQIVAYDSIPATSSIEDTLLAEDGDLAEFESQLRDAVGSKSK
ncbi:1,2-diacylglycerol 3-alpha-glucosyltransferase [Halorientalis persicus]|uniref:1,2-diacylglycerol 3-alpha-glucosyltransferase n=1 Tax=Halorientalis persicus TaxID=1367881 RepID=A0A1H8SXG2_9EURY|nr:glycosyltransferase family 4 protein [Halorientalis persicus]SEO83679.1 1,2-diacylglycerol 3-alpha-glucosyltransferase [Halorientalis persicus]